jgi:hypothetical protein
MTWTATASRIPTKSFSADARSASTFTLSQPLSKRIRTAFSARTDAHRSTGRASAESPRPKRPALLRTERSLRDPRRLVRERRGVQSSPTARRADDASHAAGSTDSIVSRSHRASQTTDFGFDVSGHQFGHKGMKASANLVANERDRRDGAPAGDTGCASRGRRTCLISPGGGRRDSWSRCRPVSSATGPSVRGGRATVDTRLQSVRPSLDLASVPAAATKGALRPVLANPLCSITST